MLFNHLAYIFHTTTAHFNWFQLSILGNLLEFGKCLSNKWKNILGKFVVKFLLHLGLKHIFLLV